jgi:hypothetical protein
MRLRTEKQRGNGMIVGGKLEERGEEKEVYGEEKVKRKNEDGMID